jgi:hypothetical protein
MRFRVIHVASGFQGLSHISAQLNHAGDLALDPDADPAYCNLGGLRHSHLSSESEAPLRGVVRQVGGCSCYHGRVQ